MREPVTLTLALADEAATHGAGAALAHALLADAAAGLCVTLAGDLGAGKTTLVRGVLRALGVVGAVRSPTYTLLESYPVEGGAVHHLDWYRLGGVDDLEGLGFRELSGPGQWIFVEWPQQVPGVAATADLAIALAYAGAARSLEARALTPVGAAVLARWMAESALDNVCRSII